MFSRSITTWGFAVIPLVMASMAMAADPWSPEIKGTAHDFSAQGWSGFQICKPCHAPHFAQSEAVSTRLWNHKLTDATYELKASNPNPSDPSQAGTGTAADDLDRISRLCMSCHDGTVAVDAFGGKTSGDTFVKPENNLSKVRDASGTITDSPTGKNDLTDDHPVGVWAVYDATSTRYNNAVTPNSSGTSGSVKARTKDTTKSLSLYKNASGQYIVSCYSCHNPHGSGITPTGGNKNQNLLRITTDESSLCLTCHNK
jgi:hypothetical protein